MLTLFQTTLNPGQYLDNAVPKTFLSYIKVVNRRILRLLNCEISGHVIVG